MATTKKSKVVPIKKPAATIKPQAAVVTAEPEVKIEAPKSRGLGIGALVKQLIAQNLNTDEILVKVKEQFPSASTNKACIAWYRADLKKKS